MKKIMIMVLVLMTGMVYAGQIKTINIASSGATYLSGTWVNNTAPKKIVRLESAFIKYDSAPTLDSTATVKVSNGGVTYTVDSVTTTSNGLTYATVDFDNPIYCGYGETVTVSRTVSSTNIAVNVMLVVE